MNLVYSVSAYPFGKLSDRMSHRKLLAFGLIVLILADIILAASSHWFMLLLGVGVWGVHMGMTQGLLAAMVAGTVLPNMRGTGFGFFNLVSGLAMLIASAVAGLVWDKWGAEFTFYCGATFCLLALGGVYHLRFSPELCE